MNVFKRLFGHPSESDYIQATTTALASLPDDPAGANEVLAALGDLRRRGAVPVERWCDALALRVATNVILGNATLVDRDVQVLGSDGTCRPRQEMLEPMVKALVADPPGAGSVAGWLSTGPGCGRQNCSHTDGVHAAIAIVDRTGSSDPSSLLALLADVTDESVWLAGIRAVRRDQGARQALEVAQAAHDTCETPRLGRALMALLFETGAFDQAVRLGEPGDTLRGFAAYGAIGAATKPPAALWTILREQAAGAQAPPALVALSAEVDGRYEDASLAWSSAGFAAESSESGWLASPDAAPVPHLYELSPDEHWLLFALGRGSRPSTSPRRPASVKNANVGDTLSSVGDMRSGRVPDAVHPATSPDLVNAVALLTAIRDSPAAVDAAMSNVIPDGIAPTALVAAVVDELRAPQAARTRETSRWRELEALQREDASPLPQPTSVDAVLAGADDGRTITADDLSSLARDQAAASAAALALTSRPDLASWYSTAVSMEGLSASLPAALDEVVVMLAVVAGQIAQPDDIRRRAGMAAGAGLATMTIRGHDADATWRAAELVEASMADIQPSPAALQAKEAYRVELDYLTSLRGDRRRAWGPVLASMTSLEPTVSANSSDPDLFGRFAQPWLLIRVGRPDDAVSWLETHGGKAAPSRLTDRLTVVKVERALAGGDSLEAGRRLAALKDHGETDDLASRVARRIDRDDVDASAAIAVLDDLIDFYPDVDAVAVALASELNTRATEHIETDIDAAIRDLERVIELDPEHPFAQRGLAYTLVSRAMTRYERSPAMAIADVDRATDLFMGDAQFVEMASGIANAAGVVLGNRRDMLSARSAWRLALAIDAKNSTARMNLYQTGGL